MNQILAFYSIHPASPVLVLAINRGGICKNGLILPPLSVELGYQRGFGCTCFIETVILYYDNLIYCKGDHFYV